MNTFNLQNLKSTSFLQKILQKLHIDIPLFIALLLCSVISFAVLYSASGQDSGILFRQLIRVGFSFFLMVALAHISPDKFKHYTIHLYVAGLIFLVAVWLVGTKGKGAVRWLDLGLFRFQPSEMIKISTPMMLAWYLSEHHCALKWKELVIASALILVPTLLIARQPDLGTSILIASSGGAVLFFAGLSWRFILFIVGIIGAFSPIFWIFLIKHYQKERIWTFLDPTRDPLGKGYHIIQSKIAIGSGGIYGKGWGGNTQAQLNYLPESSTDFIFAVFAEEFGLAGCLVLLLIYLFIIGRGLYIAVQAKNIYSRLLACSLSFTFFTYVFVNIGMVIGVLPVVGVPLPLISYGGTSMVTLFASFGILMSIHSHKKFLTH